MSRSAESPRTDGIEPVPQRPHDFSTRPPAITILSDHASHDRGEDIFEKGSFALQADSDRLELHTRLASIFDILRHRNTRCPLAVAIYGDWGSGKTSAMRWLESRLREWNKVEKKNRASDMDGTRSHPRVYPVWFDPWRYQTREEVWRGIIAEVILALFDIEHLDRQNLVPRLMQAAKKFGAFLGKSFLHGLANIEFKATGGAVPGDPSLSGEAFRDIWEEYQKAAQPHEAYLNQFEATLRQWVTDFLAGPDQGKKGGSSLLKEPARLCIFIDDLDRCLPEVTLQVIEALKLYLNIDHLIFVVGLDDSVVRSIITQHYKKNGVSEEKALSYLDKIFQVEQRITVTGKRMPEYMRQQIEVLDQASDRYWSRMLDPTGHKEALEQSLVHLAGNNPRTCKRLLNSAFLLGQAASLDSTLTPEAGAPKVADFGNDPRQWQPAIKAWQERMRHLRFAQGVQVYAIQTWFRQRFKNTRDLMEEPQTVEWLERASGSVQTILESKLVNSEVLYSVLHAVVEARNGKDASDLLQNDAITIRVARERYRHGPQHHDDAMIPDEVWENCIAFHDHQLRGSPHEDASIVSSPIFLRLLSVPFSAAIAEHFPPSRTAPSSISPPQPSLDTVPSHIRESLAYLANIPLEDLRPEHLHEMQRLYLIGVPLNSAELSNLLYFCKPEELDLSNNKGLQDTAALSGQHQLEELNLSYCTDLEGAAAWRGLAGVNNLKVLNLTGCTGLRDTAALVGLRQLEKLRLSSCSRLEGSAAWRGLAGLESLRELYLSHCTGLRDTAALAGLRQLETLDLSGCTGLEGATAWSGLAGLESLRELHLSDCSGLRHTAALARLHQLEKLNLLECTGLEGAKAWSGLAELESLRVLSLMRCPGLRDTTVLAGLHQLELLNLTDCSGLESAGALQGLAGLEHLRELYLLGCTGLDAEAVREVRRMIRPECRIIGPNGEVVKP